MNLSKIMKKVIVMLTEPDADVSYFDDYISLRTIEVLVGDSTIDSIPVEPATSILIL